VHFIDNIADLFIEPAARPLQRDGNFSGYSARI
jgi:hypothetical protein